MGGGLFRQTWRRHSCLPRRDSDLLIWGNEDELAFESRQKHHWPPMNADRNKTFSYRRASAFIGGSIFFAPAPRDSVWTDARPGRPEKVAQSDSGGANTQGGPQEV